VSVLVGVDVGGSGLRCGVEVDGVVGPVHAAPGVRITAGGIDTDALIDSVAPLVAPAGPPDVLVWSMRGLVALADPVLLMAALRARVGAGRTALVGDAVAAMVGAVGGVMPGAVVAAGSGAVAFATDFERTWRRIDGWGHVLGDRGSSAWVGLRALESALQAYDGVRDEGGPLLVAMTGRLGDPESWPRHVMTRPDAVEVIAALAPTVTALAATDAEAARICTGAGQALARSLAAAAAGIPGARLSRTGGLFGAAPVLEAFAVEAARLGLDVHPALGTNLDGALHLARHLAAGRPLVGTTAYVTVG
jgi:N-acetylglucosamine kinase-like BadF-type ATPase